MVHSNSFYLTFFSILFNQVGLNPKSRSKCWLAVYQSLCGGISILSFPVQKSPLTPPTCFRSKFNSNHYTAAVAAATECALPDTPPPPPPRSHSQKHVNTCLKGLYRQQQCHRRDVLWIWLLFLWIIQDHEKTLGLLVYSYTQAAGYIHNQLAL